MYRTFTAKAVSVYIPGQFMVQFSSDYRPSEHLTLLTDSPGFFIIGRSYRLAVNLVAEVSEQNQAVPAPLGATGAAKTEKES